MVLINSLKINTEVSVELTNKLKKEQFSKIGATLTATSADGSGGSGFAFLWVPRACVFLESVMKLLLLLYRSGIHWTVRNGKPLPPLPPLPSAVRLLGWR